VPGAQPSTIIVNGEATAAIAVADRALQYGDGLFETIAVRNGRLCLWERHMARLALGAERLGLPPPPEPLLRAEAATLAAGQANAVLKLIYSAGSGGRGYARPQPASPSRILQILPAPAYPPSHWRDGVAARICDLRLAQQPRLAGIKHLNRLEQVLARREWNGAEFAEGLLLDQQDHVIEGTISNVFLVRGGRLRTPALDACGVRGVMRDRVLELATELGLTAEEGTVTLADLGEADEVFLTNSLIGVWPVVCLGSTRLRPGPVARALLTRLRAADECLLPVGDDGDA